MSSETSPYQIAYTRKVNKFAFLFLLAHLPVLCAVAMFENISPWSTAAIMLLLLAGPAAVLFRDPASELGGIALAVSAMGVSALAIYCTNGMIEAHFELFVLIALLTVFGRRAPLLIAGGVIALHHLVFWIWLPTAIFNYKASLGIVFLHAAFVIMEVIPACWIAQQLGRSIKAQGLIAEHLSGASEQIALAAKEISASMQSLALGASHHAASIEEASASIGEIRSMTLRNTEGSGCAARIVAEAGSRFEDANRSLSGTVAAMAEVGASSQQISGIIKVIDQIAFQTNILALNAAVEAARAGEAGMGFAVVAEEVRSLARRTAEAARDTSTLIEDSIVKSRSGIVKVDQVAAEIATLTSDFSRMKSLVEEIHLGSQEQSKGITQVANSIQEMEQVTQSSAAGSEEMAGAAEQLTEQSGLIRGLVDRLAALGGVEPDASSAMAG